MAKRSSEASPPPSPGPKRHRLHKPPLTIPQILAWADAHQRRTGKWPTIASGQVVEAVDENWGAINNALYQGVRRSIGQVVVASDSCRAPGVPPSYYAGTGPGMGQCASRADGGMALGEFRRGLRRDRRDVAGHRQGFAAGKPGPSRRYFPGRVAGRTPRPASQIGRAAYRSSTSTSASSFLIEY